MVYTFKVDRPPLVMTLVASYQFSPSERQIVLTRIAYARLTEDKDHAIEEDSKEDLDPFDDLGGDDLDDLDD